jgi:hypothetical protein
METEIEIDENGDILLNRDHELMKEIALLLNPDDKEFQDFFNSKPKNIQGETNYPSFCG